MFAFPAWGLGAQGATALIAVTPLLMAGTLGADGGAPLRRHAEVHDVARTQRLTPNLGNVPALSVTLAALVADGVHRSQPETGTGLRGAGHGRRPREIAPEAVETRFDFDEDQVEGTLRAPDEIRVDGRQPTKNPSLIELRRDFVPELVKGLEDID